MKYKNVSDKTQMFMINNKWVNVKPDGEIDTPVGVSINTSEMVCVATHEEPSLIPVETKDDDTEEITYTEDELKKMTKDEINDYAAQKGWDNINTSWKKARMIKEVLVKQDETE